MYSALKDLYERSFLVDIIMISMQSPNRSGIING